MESNRELPEQRASVTFKAAIPSDLGAESPDDFGRQVSEATKPLNLTIHPVPGAPVVKVKKGSGHDPTAILSQSVFVPDPHAELPSVDEFVAALQDGLQGSNISLPAAEKTKIAYCIDVRGSDPPSRCIILCADERYPDAKRGQIRRYWYHLLTLSEEGTLGIVGLNLSHSEVQFEITTAIAASPLRLPDRPSEKTVASGKTVHIYYPDADMALDLLRRSKYRGP